MYSTTMLVIVPEAICFCNFGSDGCHVCTHYYQATMLEIVRRCVMGGMCVISRPYVLLLGCYVGNGAL